MTQDLKTFTVIASEETPDRHVSMSNRLARSAQGLNLAEKRLVALGLAGTDSVALKGLSQAVNGGWKLRISAMEYAETFAVSTPPPTSSSKQRRKSCSSDTFDTRSKAGVASWKRRSFVGFQEPTTHRETATSS